MKHQGQIITERKTQCNKLRHVEVTEDIKITPTEEEEYKETQDDYQ